MALNYNRVKEVADQMKSCAEDLKRLHLKVVKALETNSDLSIDWAAGAKPAYINEDVDGNLDGYRFTRAQVANLIGSLAQLRNLVENQAVSQGDHLGNLNLVANADV